MLLTTLAVSDFAVVIEKLRWYAERWGIEVFHRVPKSGCKVETRQLGTADSLVACLAIDLVVAWRIFSDQTRPRNPGRAVHDLFCRTRVAIPGRKRARPGGD